MFCRSGPDRSAGADWSAGILARLSAKREFFLADRICERAAHACGQDARAPTDNESLRNLNPLGAAGFDSAVGPVGHDVMTKTTLCVAAFLRDNHLLGGRKVRVILQFLVSPGMKVATLPSMVASPIASPMFG